MKKLIRLTEGDLHRIVKESVNIVLKEAYNGGKLTVYHITNPKAAQKVMHNGFSPAMYRSNASTYGNGIYCTFTPSPKIKDVYGGCIIKCQTYINNTIFFDLDLAREYAGMSPEMVADDIEKKLGPEAAQRFVELVSNETRSSYIAIDFLKNGYLDDTFNIAFNSSHDGPVLVVRNPRLVNPLEIIQEGVNNMEKIRLTESDIHRIVKESVNRVLNEIGDTPRGQYMLGRTGERARRRDDGKTMNMARQTAFRSREDNPNLGKGYESYGSSDQYNHEETGRELPNRNGTLFN